MRYPQSFAEADGMNEAEAETFARRFDIREAGRDPAYLENPYPTYRLLRRTAPVLRMPDGSYFLTRYDDIMQVYRGNKRFSSDKKVEFGPKYGEGTPLYRHHTTSLVFNDPPLHARVRKRIADSFTPRALKQLEDNFAVMVDNLLDEAEDRGGMDVIGEYASRLPVEIIGDMLAIPRDERGPLRDWSLAVLGALEPVLTEEAMDWGNRSIEAFSDYLDMHIARWRKTPEAERDPKMGEVLNKLLEEGDKVEPLSHEELIQNCIFLLNAGHETTTNLIGNGIAALLENPRAMADLRAEPDLIGAAVEEFLRFESSNQLGNRRVVERVALGDATFEPGDLVTLCIGAANRDPERFPDPDPDTLDIRRSPNRHLAFAAGIHACAGMSLARLEGRLAIGKLLARVPEFRLSGEPVRGGRARFRGYLSYPIAFG